MIYEPNEDSFLLQGYVKKYAKGIVLDIGTGSGILAITSAEKKSVTNVTALDIQQDAIDYCNTNIRNKKVKFLKSDLFSELRIKQKFDTIIFNPPYLPKDKNVKEAAIYGGKKGYELIERFLSDVGNHLKQDGRILMVFSSLTNKAVVDRLIKEALLEYRELERMHLFFEDLYVYIITKSRILKKLEKEGLRNIKYFTKGHRGLLFKADYGVRKAVIKMKNPDSAAKNRIENEISYLKLLNKYEIGPALLFSSGEYFVYEYVNGIFLPDLCAGMQTTVLKNIIRNVLKQLYKLDKLKIDKEEMHHPDKHIIIDKYNKVVLLDFERCHKASRPKNITQFCQYLMSNKIRGRLKNKGINLNQDTIINLAKEYKKSYDMKIIKNMVSELGF